MILSKHKFPINLFIYLLIKGSWPFNIQSRFEMGNMLKNYY